MSSLILLRPRVLMDGVDQALPQEGKDYDFSDPSVLAYFPMNEAAASPCLDVKNANNFASSLGFPLVAMSPPWDGVETRGISNASASQTTPAFRLNGDLTVFVDSGNGAGQFSIACYTAALTTDPLWGVGVGATSSLWSCFDKASTTTVTRAFSFPYRAIPASAHATSTCFVRRSNVWELWIGGVLQSTLTGFTNARTVLGTESLVFTTASNSSFAKVMIANKAFSEEEIKYQFQRRLGR